MYRIVQEMGVKTPLCLSTYMYEVIFVCVRVLTCVYPGNVHAALALTPLANLTFASEIYVGDITDKWNATRNCRTCDRANV